MIQFNAKGTPYTSIEIYGVYVQQAQTFEAIVDTGFDGFVRMPFLRGIPLGLITYSVGEGIQADGSKSATLLCYGTIKFEERSVKGIIALGDGNDVLVGTELLKKINAKLLIDYPSNSCKLI